MKVKTMLDIFGLSTNYNFTKHNKQKVEEISVTSWFVTFNLPLRKF